jgi:membrane-associated phospholipid phosphatase
LLLRAAVVLLMVLICVATLFVKQHSVWDVAAGTALSLVLYGVVLLYRKKKMLN